MSKLCISVDLSPWRQATPSSHEHWIRDWIPQAPLLIEHSTDGGNVPPELRGAAASVREHAPVIPGHPRWSWRIWTPVGTIWPYRSWSQATAALARDAADAALAELAGALTGIGRERSGS
jgi:hypothetical protein